MYELFSPQARDPFSLCNQPKFKQFVCHIHLGHNHHHHPGPPRESPQLRHPPQPRQPITSTTTSYHHRLDHNRIANKKGTTEAWAGCHKQGLGVRYRQRVVRCPDNGNEGTAALFAASRSCFLVSPLKNAILQPRWRGLHTSPLHLPSDALVYDHDGKPLALCMWTVV